MQEIGLENMTPSIRPTGIGWCMRLLVSVLISLWTYGSVAARALPEEVYMMVVNVQLESKGVGSGFLIKHEGSWYLTTARHVLIDQMTDSLKADSARFVTYGSDAENPAQIVFDVDLRVVDSSGELRRHSVHDVLVIRLVVVDSTEGGVRNITVPGVSRTDSSGIAVHLWIRSEGDVFDSVSVGSEAFIIGYPSSLLSKRLDHSKPMISSGVISGKNYKNRLIFTDCAVYYGNSGGPLIIAKRFLTEDFRERYLFVVVGVATELVPGYLEMRFGTDSIQIIPGNSGYSVVVPMDFVGELIETWSK